MSGGGSKGAQQGGSTTSTQMPASYSLPFIGTGLTQSANILNGPGPQFYPGQQVAQFNPLQQTAMGDINRLGTQGTPGMNAAGNFDQKLLTTGMNNPWLQNQYNVGAGNIENSLTSQFGTAGRNAEASQPLEGEALGNFASNLYGSQYQNTIQDALQAGNQAQSLYGTRMQGLGQALGIGNQIQGQSQNLINADQTKYNYYQNLPQQMLSQYQQNIGGFTPGMQQQNPYFTNPGANALGEGLGGLALYNGIKGAMHSGAGAAAAGGSDRRLKEDIKRIGSTENGLPVYTFRYKGQPQVMMGVMSDDVRKVQPEAVIVDENGYDKVYYGMLK